MGMNNIMPRYKTTFCFNLRKDSRIIKQWIAIISYTLKGMIRLFGREMWHFQMKNVLKNKEKRTQVILMYLVSPLLPSLPNLQRLINKEKWMD